MYKNLKRFSHSTAEGYGEIPLNIDLGKIQLGI